MGLIDKLTDLIIKIDEEYQRNIEAVIREVVPGMPEDRVRYVAGLMVEDRTCGDEEGLDSWILRAEERPFEHPYLREILDERIAEIRRTEEDIKVLEVDKWCGMCGSHDHLQDLWGGCWYCGCDDHWEKEDKNERT